MAYILLYSIYVSYIAYNIWYAEHLNLVSSLFEICNFFPQNLLKYPKIKNITKITQK